VVSFRKVVQKTKFSYVGKKLYMLTKACRKMSVYFVTFFTILRKMTTVELLWLRRKVHYTLKQFTLGW